jgi:hypothetical protein
MNRQALRALLDQENIDPGAYDLGGHARDETYVLERASQSWTVYFSERGLRTSERRFDDEDEACSHLLDLLLRDRTTRRS